MALVLHDQVLHVKLFDVYDRTNAPPKKYTCLYHFTGGETDVALGFLVRFLGFSGLEAMYNACFFIYFDYIYVYV